MTQDHQPHILRAHRNEWCGGTEPPTMVTEHPEVGSLTVTVFEEGDNIHVGQIIEPAHTVEFLALAGTRLSIPQIRDFAGKAIASVE